jgi:hypothetical protein
MLVVLLHKISPSGLILFCFLMRRMRSAMLAELLKLQALLDGFYVFVHTVICCFTLGAFHFDGIVLRHIVCFECSQSRGFSGFCQTFGVFY